MQAMLIDQFGGREQLRLGEVPRPEPGRGEVLVRVMAAGVNPVDAKIREGLLRARLPHQFPIILGWDVAGVVESAGPGVRRFKQGDAVFAYARKPIVKDGAYAEYIVIPQASLALKPAALDFAQAAAVPLAALTAWQSLFDVARLRRGQRVLIHAGAGGVGGFAIQLAAARGAWVATTARDERADYVRSLGAQLVIDHTREDFVETLRRQAPGGLDVVFDTVGAEVQRRSAEVLAPGGVLVSLLAFQDEEGIRARGVVPRYHFVRPDAADLRQLAAMADQGRLRVHLDARLPLAEAASAHEMIESRHTWGKIVLDVASA